MRTTLWSLMTLAALALALPAVPAVADDKDDSAKAEAASEKKGDAEGKDEEKPADKDKADKDGEEDKQAAKKKPERKTFKVKKKPLKIEVTISGDLVARKMTPVVLDADSWSKFEIEEVVPHGARVRSGETLVRFDPEELDEAIASLELSQRISEISLIKAEQELPRLEESIERQLKSAQRRWDQEQEDYKRYKDEERELVTKSVDMRLKQSEASLAYVKDELEQLQKMYEADDLTEETEEMILRRQKTQLEFAKFSYEMAKYNHTLNMDVFLPRQDEQLKEAQRSVEIALERAKSSSELDLSRARYELEQLRIARRKALEKHAEMISDKRLMTIKAPVAGVAYYGRCVNGKWGEISSTRQKLLPEKAVPKGTVMMTIVDPSELYVLGAVAEKDLPSVKTGQPAMLELTAEGADPIKAKVAQVDAAPISAGKFGIEVDVTGDTPDWLVPGMTGKVKITTYKNKSALMVPKEAIRTDEESGKKYVWEIEEEDGETEVEKEWVKTGKSDGKLVEILDGIDEGEVISLDPNEKGTEDEDDDEDEDEDEDDD